MKHSLLLMLCALIMPLAAIAQTDNKDITLEDIQELISPDDIGSWEEMMERARDNGDVTLYSHARELDGVEKTATYEEALAPFYHGVASGDPLADRVLIWTRVTTDATGPVTVNWSMATDVGMEDVIASGSVTTGPDEDYTVKVDVTGLEANTYYYYQFEHAEMPSIVGRTLTTPIGNVDRLRFGVVSCSHYQQGFFGAYGNLAQHLDLNAIIHLGDYIYEYGIGDDFVDSTDAPRVFEPEHEILDISDYRTRHSLYRLDPHLRELHQQFPFITVWDDHETANDAWKDGAQNHTEGVEGAWEDRKAAGVQAYFEWLPIRDAAEGEEQRVYRTVSYGDLCDLIMIDTRLAGRDQQADDEEGMADTTRTILGEEQYNWFIEQLDNSTAQWKIIGNQVIMAPTNFLGILVNDDQWDGYVSDRNKVLGHIADNNIEDVVVITGDIHMGMAFDVTTDFTDNYDAETGEGAVAVEFVTPSVTSANGDDIDLELPFDLSVVETIALGANPHGSFVNIFDHGYFILDLQEGQAQADWYYLNDKLDPNTDESNGPSFYTDSGNSFLQAAEEALAENPGYADPAPVYVAVEELNANNEPGLLILSTNPNPFTVENQLTYAVNDAQQVNISLFDITGKKVAQLLNEFQAPGIYSLHLKGDQLAAGAYVYKITTEKGELSRKIILQK